MAPRVLLLDTNTCTDPYPVYPLGLAYIAAALSKAGYHPVTRSVAAGDTEIEEYVRDSDPVCVGISLRNIDDTRIEDTAFYLPAVSRVVERVRSATAAPIVLGGSGYSLFPAELLRATGADYGIHGEGEKAFPRLLGALAGDRPLHSIGGLVRRVDGQVTVNPGMECSIEDIPVPSYDPNLARFFVRHSSMLGVQTQRGCGLRCSYCTYPLIEGKRFRRRPAERVCDDMEAALRSGAGYVFVVDSVFNSSEDHVAAICEEILRRGVIVQWGCFLRPRGIEQSLMDLMARAGLRHVEFGTDSLCDSVLERMGKDFSVDDVVRTSACARNARVHVAHFLIMGGPGETERTLDLTFANSERIGDALFFPFVGTRLYPGTPLHRHALNEGTVSREENLLRPYFYVSPSLSVKTIERRLADWAGRTRNWVVDDGRADPALMARLRQRGRKGPLWEYMAV